MVAAAVLLGLLLASLVITFVVSSPATARSRERVSTRRRRFVEQNPTHVTTADIVDALRRDGISREQAGFITRRAADQGIKPFTMWLWLQQFDGEALSIVVAADLTHAELLTYISEGTRPDLGELSVFAALNGLAVSRADDEAVDRPSHGITSVPSLAERGLRPRRRAPLTPTHDGGAAA